MVLKKQQVLANKKLIGVLVEKMAQITSSISLDHAGGSKPSK